MPLHLNLMEDQLKVGLVTLSVLLLDYMINIDIDIDYTLTYYIYTVILTMLTM